VPRATHGHCHAHDLGGWARLLREAWAGRRTTESLTAAEVPGRLIADQPRQRRFLLHLYEVGVHALKANDLPAQWFPLLHIVERVVQSRRLRWPAKSRLRGCGCTTV